jgi:integrase
MYSRPYTTPLPNTAPGLEKGRPELLLGRDPEGRSAGLLQDHGLREAAARRLAEAGCTTKQIASATGHKSLAEIERYTAAEQERLAREAMAKQVGSRDWQTGPR